MIMNFSLPKEEFYEFQIKIIIWWKSFWVILYVNFKQLFCAIVMVVFFYQYIFEKIYKYRSKFK